MNTIKSIVGFLFSLVFITSLFVLIMILNISCFFKVENMQTNISSIDISHQMKKIKNSSATNDNKAEIADIINTAYMEAENHGIPTKLVDTIFNSKEIKEFLGYSIGTTTDYIINNNKNKSKTSKEFNQILDQNIDKWVKESNTDISDSKKEALIVRMKSASKGAIDSLPTYKTVAKNMNKENLDMVHLIFSTKAKITLIILTLISLIIIILVEKQHFAWMVYTGTSLLFSGLMTVGISFIMGDLIVEALADYNLSFITNPLTSVLSHELLITGLVICTTSIIMFIVYNIIKRKKA